MRSFAFWLSFHQLQLTRFLHHNNGLIQHPAQIYLLASTLLSLVNKKAILEVLSIKMKTKSVMRIFTSLPVVWIPFMDVWKTAYQSISVLDPNAPLCFNHAYPQHQINLLGGLEAKLSISPSLWSPVTRQEQYWIILWNSGWQPVF